MSCSKCLYLAQDGRKKVCKNGNSNEYGKQKTYCCACNQFVNSGVSADITTHFYIAAIKHERIRIDLKCNNREILLSFLRSISNIDGKSNTKSEIMSNDRFNEKFIDFFESELPDVYKSMLREFKKLIKMEEF